MGSDTTEQVQGAWWLGQQQSDAETPPGTEYIIPGEVFTVNVDHSLVLFCFLVISESYSKGHIKKQKLFFTKFYNSFGDGHAP